MGRGGRMTLISGMESIGYLTRHHLLLRIARPSFYGNHPQFKTKRKGEEKKKKKEK